MTLRPRRSRSAPRVAALLVALAVSFAIACDNAQPPANLERTPRPASTTSTTDVRADPQDHGAPAATVYPLTISTPTGPFTLERRPERIVAQTLAAAEILVELVEPERLVGVTATALDPAYSNAADHPVAQAAAAVADAEQIAALEPDLILVADYSRADVVVQLEQVTGAAVFRLGPYDDVESVRQSIQTLGRLVDRQPQAAAMLQTLDQRIAEALDRVPDAVREDPGRRPRVISLAAGRFTAGGETLFDDLVRLVGARNAAAEAGITGFREVGLEKLLAMNPRVILVPVEAGGEADAIEAVVTTPGLASVDAVRDGRVHAIDHPRFTAVSQHLAWVVEAMVEAIHGPRDRGATPATSAPATGGTP